MRQILPYSLWLGHAGDGRDFVSILGSGIKSVVQLAAEEPPLQLPRDLISCRFPLLDGPGNDATILYLATTTVANQLEKRVPMLVCCGGGMSRSPAVAAAALAMVFQETLEDCLKKIAVHHPADVDPGLWNEIESLFDFDAR